MKTGNLLGCGAYCPKCERLTFFANPRKRKTCTQCKNPLIFVNYRNVEIPEKFQTIINIGAAAAIIPTIIWGLSVFIISSIIQGIIAFFLSCIPIPFVIIGFCILFYCRELRGKETKKYLRERNAPFLCVQFSGARHNTYC